MMDNDNVDLDLTRKCVPCESSTIKTTIEIVFGKRLKKEREKRRLSVSDMADRLYLSEDVIKLIEADEYYGKTDTVFVCGHIRAYSRLLDIPSEEVDQLFNQLDILVRKSEAKPLKFHMKHPVLKDKSIRLMTYTVIVVLLGLLLTWYLSHRNKITNDVLTVPTISDSENSIQGPLNSTLTGLNTHLNDVQNTEKNLDKTHLGKKEDQKQVKKQKIGLPWLKKH